jgi:hypothetical protein
MRSATQAMQSAAHPPVHPMLWSASAAYGRKSISSFGTRPAGGQTRPSVTLMTDLIDRASAAPSHIGSLAVHRESGLWFRSVRVRALEYNERRTVA